MTASEQEITKHNQEAHLPILSSQIEKKTEELNSISSEFAQAVAIIAESKRLKKETDEYITKEKQKLEDTRVKSNARLVEKNTEIEALTPKANQLKDDISKSTKELSRINRSCLTGQEEIESNTKKISELSKEIANLTNLVIHYEEVKEQVRLLEIVASQQIVSIADAKTKSDNYLLEARETLSKINIEIQTLVVKRDETQSQLKSYTDELYTAMNDYQVIKTRLEGVWNKTFPELDIPLRM